MPVARTRQLAVFDRFLARIAVVFGDAATLKGGVALELRLERARTTKDIDRRVMGTPDDLLERLENAGRLDLDDFLSFEIDADPHRPEIEAEGMKYDGFRFRAEAKLAGKLYGQRFGVDVAFGELREQRAVGLWRSAGYTPRRCARLGGQCFVPSSQRIIVRVKTGARRLAERISR